MTLLVTGRYPHSFHNCLDDATTKGATILTADTAWHCSSSHSSTRTDTGACRHCSAACAACARADAAVSISAMATRPATVPGAVSDIEISPASRRRLSVMLANESSSIARESTCTHSPLSTERPAM